MKPFLKWAGGKTHLLPELLKYVPETYERYIDPFVGGGALLFELKPERAIITDANKVLSLTYEAIQLRVNAVIELLKQHKRLDSKDYFDVARSKLIAATKRRGDYDTLAALFMYINKVCFNGLFRVNKTNVFNVPYGYYNNPKIYTEKHLVEVSRYLNKSVYVNTNHEEKKGIDFRVALSIARHGDFVYVDPPYHGGFTAYTAQGFTEQDQANLARICADLAGKGCHILASNSNTDFIKQLWGQYGCFDVHEVDAPRSINCKGTGRGKVKELIITNVRGA